MPPSPSQDPDSSSDPLVQFAERFFAATPAERDGVLRDLKAAHPAHADELQRLAGDLAGADRLLDRGFGGKTMEHPTAIGDYRVGRVLGEGAFGVVYLCMQESPIHREVAVKVLRPGAGDRNSLQRFEAERHFLARMSHPAITQVFDAGLLPDGRPYFVMEHVRGLPITKYCDEHSLSIEARLALFVRLCQGVQHAHEQGILHRDLKPANILVVEIDGVAQPKIIDFGIARALQQDGEHAEFRTDTGRVVGTPGYMSPEQADGRRDEVDARADMFSLGAILYELLTGELPWGRRPTSTDSQPPRPSQRVNTDPTRTTEIAQRRSSQPRRLASQLRGDLDWIVLKAVALDRAQRYQSAHDLVDEIGRHLHNEPVLAGPPSLAYRLRKVLRRHRTALSTAAAVTILGIGGIGFSAHFRAEAQTRGGEAAAAVAGLLARANDPRIITAPDSAELRQTLAHDALDFYDRFLRERPTDIALREGRARTLWTLSQVHWLLGQYAKSEATAREAVAASEELLVERPFDLKFRGVLGNACRNLGRALASSGQDAAARPQFERATELLDGCYAESPTKYAGLAVRALLELQSTMDGARETAACVAVLARASKIQQEIVARSPELVAERSSLILVDLQRVTLLIGSGELAAATELVQQADKQLRKAPEMVPSTVTSLHLMAANLHSLAGDHAAAIERLRQALAVAQKWREREPSNALPLNHLASIYTQLSQQQDAVGDAVGVVATCHAAVALGETRVARFPEDQIAKVTLAAGISDLANAQLSGGRRSGIVDAGGLLNRARELLDQIAPSVDQELRMRLRWSVLGSLALLLEGNPSGETSAADVWPQASESLLAWHQQFGVRPEYRAAVARTGLALARFHLQAGEDAAAGAVLELVEPPLRDQDAAPGGDVGAPEAFHLRALLAVRRGEPAVAAAQAELAQAANAGAAGTLAAARAMHATWQATRTAGQPNASYRDRAIAIHRAVIIDLQGLVLASPDDLWVVVPFAQVRILLAQALADCGETAEATALAEAAVRTLTAVREETLAFEWNEELFRAGQALCPH